MLDRAEGHRARVAAEVTMLREVQRRAGHPGFVSAARGMSCFGEHAFGWIALGGLGAAFDGPRRRQWITVVGGVVAAHGASIVLKRVVRRVRPHDAGVQVHVGTPSRLSFPSSHATSTTAAALLFSGLLGRGEPVALVPLMALSRIVLGVHYPTDVLAGSALGTVCALGVRRALRRGAVGRWRTA